MSKYSIEDTTLTAIGNALRAKENSEDPIPVVDIASHIEALSIGTGGGSIPNIYCDVEAYGNSEGVVYREIDVSNADILKFTYSFRRSTNSTYKAYFNLYLYGGYQVSLSTNTIAPGYTTTAVDTTTASQAICSNISTSITAASYEYDVSNYTSVVIKVVLQGGVSGTYVPCAAEVVDITLE